MVGVGGWGTQSPLSEFSGSAPDTSAIQVTITTNYRSYIDRYLGFYNGRLETTDKEKDKKCFGSKATTSNYGNSKNVCQRLST